MGKKRKNESDSSEEDVKKKKKDKKKGKDKKKEKSKKKEKKKDKKKDKKKQESSSSSDSSGGEEAIEEKQVEAEKEVVKVDLQPPKEDYSPPVNLDELAPPEEGIRRFMYTTEEAGPLGLRFSGGFPPLILAVTPESFSGKKGVPANFEVHAINGFPLVPQNRDSVMSSLKARPVVLDVRPQGWKPKEKVRELEKRREREEAERLARVQMEEHRREQVAREAAEEAERVAAEKAIKEEEDRREREDLERRAKEVLIQRRAREEEFRKAVEAEPEDLRRAAQELLEAEYGSSVNVKGRRGLPLRLMTRRKDVAWCWAGEAQELIGGGMPDAGDEWTQ